MLQSSARGWLRLCRHYISVWLLPLLDPVSFPFYMLTWSSCMPDPFSVSAFGEPTCNRAHTKLISAGKPRKLFSLQRHLVRQKITTQGIHCWLPQEPTVPQPGQQELYDVSFFSRHLSMKWCLLGVFRCVCVSVCMCTILKIWIKSNLPPGQRTPK